MSLKLTTAILGLALSLPLSQAQMRGGIGGAGGAGGASFGPPAHVGGQHFGGQHFAHSGVFLGEPFWYANYPYESATPPASQPQVIVVQVPGAATEPPPEPKPEPLLIELQGDQYVRVGGAQAAAKNNEPAQVGRAEVASPKAAAARPAAATQPAGLRPVVIVYRDGRREELRDYTIVDGIIYARGNYWTDGFWAKQIRLTALNLPASMKASQEQGAAFVLPSSSNEVITRP